MGSHDFPRFIVFLIGALIGIVVVVYLVYIIFSFCLFAVCPPPMNSCVFPAGFYCQNIFIASNGLVTLNLQQIGQSAINITAYGCNTNQTIAHMKKVFNPPTNQIRMQIGANYTMSVFCYSGSTVFTGNPGTHFPGYFFLNYTNLNAGFPQTVTGQIATQVQ